ncbi:hypothetical protein [Herbiconiux sp.]|uniref:hypothetical protein n=1 Tax=Herbiconiux sp. TaxID=1871186 RepID=UPI0025BEC2A6|nr:hypothetical protein [Herbiconiux sp.]
MTGLVKFCDLLNPSSPSSLRDRTPTSPATRTCPAESTRPAASKSAMTSSTSSPLSPANPAQILPTTPRRSAVISGSSAAVCILRFYQKDLMKARLISDQGAP